MKRVGERRYDAAPNCRMRGRERWSSNAPDPNGRKGNGTKKKKGAKIEWGEKKRPNSKNGTTVVGQDVLDQMGTIGFQ